MHPRGERDMRVVAVMGWMATHRLGVIYRDVWDAPASFHGPCFLIQLVLGREETTKQLELIDHRKIEEARVPSQSPPMIP